ncbi:MAG: hypothetical protein ACOZBH_04535 [Patescibacteria group bacterium]
MRKKLFIISIVAFIVVVSTLSWLKLTNAQVSNPIFWKRTGTTVQLLKDTWSLLVNNLTVDGTFTFSGAVSGGNLTGIQRMFGSSDAILVGYGSDSHSLAASDDLYVGGKFEVDGASYIDGAMTVYTANGIDITPGSDTDTDLLTLNVTGTPKLWWDESEDYLTTSSSFATGPIVLTTDAGLVPFVDMSITSSSAINTEHSILFSLDNDYFLKVYAESDGAGGIQKPSIRMYKPVAYPTTGINSYATADTITATATRMRITSSVGNVSMTATPTIADGSVDGQMLILQGTDDGNVLTLQDESSLANSGLQLTGGSDCALASGDILMVMYNYATDKWLGMVCSNN